MDIDAPKTKIILEFDVAGKLLAEEEEEEEVLVISLKDITERTQAEEALGASEEKYRLLTETADEGIYILSAGGFEYVNPAFERITGYTAQELIGGGLDFMGLVHHEDRKLIKQRAEERSKGREVPSRYEFRLLRKDKEVRYLDISTIALPGEPWRVMGIYRDITERKRSEEALTESEIWFRSMYNSLEETVFVVSPDRILVHMNAAGEAMFGYTEDELKGSSTENLHVDRNHYLEFERKIKAAFDQGEAATCEFKRKGKNERCWNAWE